MLPFLQLCAILCEHKSFKSVVKQAGWNPREYRRMIMETAQQFEFERISRPLSEQSGPRRRSTRKEKEKKEKKKPAPQVYTLALCHHRVLYLPSLLPLPLSFLSLSLFSHHCPSLKSLTSLYRSLLLLAFKTSPRQATR